MEQTRIFKGDKWTRILGSRIPDGSQVCVIRFYPRRRALVEYEGMAILTMLWCLKKVEHEECQVDAIKGRSFGDNHRSGEQEATIQLATIGLG